MKQLLAILIVGTLIAGAFIASPELRAYAANTVGSADIINNSIQSVDIKDAEVKSIDIKDGEVKTADIGANTVTTSKIPLNAVTISDIGPDAVEGNELVGVSKILFDKLTLPAGSTIPAGVVQCYLKSGSGAQPGDMVLATPQNVLGNNLILSGVGIDSNDGGQTFVVEVCMKNDGSTTATIPPGFDIALVVYKIGTG